MKLCLLNMSTNTCSHISFNGATIPRRFARISTLVFFITMAQLWTKALGGICWLRVDDNGNCRGMKQVGVSQADCCNGAQVGLGWTEKDDFDAGRLFFYAYLNEEGMPNCKACPQTCENVYCGENQRCRMRNGVARCICSPDCSAHTAQQRRPLCGLDGHTYRNYCSLLKSNCRRNRHTEVDYFGSRCQYTCDAVQCQAGESCMTDQHGVPHCLPCRQDCSNAKAEKICGADGVTYPSMCHYRAASCRNTRTIGIAYRGECDRSHTCDTVTCGRSLTCLWNPEKNTPHCTRCDRNCFRHAGDNVVCGSDGNTYESYCDMKDFSCATGMYIETQHYGACEHGPLDASNSHYDGMILDDEAYYYPLTD